MFDLQTHELPVSDDELRQARPAAGLRRRRRRRRWRRFARTTPTARRSTARFSTTCCTTPFPKTPRPSRRSTWSTIPIPSPETIERVLGRYPFRDVPAAYDNLMSLARESIPFLSTRRCRLFLASIAPRLLAAIARTPDPDATLVTLSRVSDSLGGKAALWELFSTQPADARPVREAVRGVPVPGGHPHEQPGHDRRADGQPARGEAARPAAARRRRSPS